MLLNSVVIVLREVLEAALMISILLATSRRSRLHGRWLGIALPTGLGGAIVYARYLGPISETFDGFGQELLNATLHALVFAALLGVVFLVVRLRGRIAGAGRLLPALMAVAVALATTQEGAEIIVYVTGFLQLSNFLGSVGIGSLAGAGIGFSIGVLFYYLLLALPARRAMWISVALLAVVAASMCLQAAKLLIQSDFLTADGPVWDTSWLLAENSLPGQLLYALVGYEATPSLVEIAAYAGSLLIICAAAALGLTIFSETNGADS